MRTTLSRLTTLTLLAMLCLVVAGGAWLAADPVAVLVQMQGAVRIQKAEQANSVPAAPGMDLAPGDLVVVPAGGRAVLLHRTGKVQTATQSVRVAAPAGRAPSSVFAQTMKTISQVATSDARDQPNRTGMIRPIPGWTELVAPRNGIVILQRRPTFTWVGTRGSRGYTLQISTAGKPPRRFMLGRDTTWTIPADSPPLTPGVAYTWTVGDSQEGRAAPPQRFRVASQAERAAVEQRLAEVRAAGLDPAGDGILLAALAYREAGMWYELDRVLQRFSSLGLAQGALYHQLRGEGFNALGDLESAAREFRLAAGATQQ